MMVLRSQARGFNLLVRVPRVRPRGDSNGHARSEVAIRHGGFLLSDKSPSSWRRPPEPELQPPSLDLLVRVPRVRPRGDSNGHARSEVAIRHGGW
jgi:hypothetical protein